MNTNSQSVPESYFDGRLEAARLLEQFANQLIDVGAARDRSLADVFANWSGPVPKSFEERHDETSRLVRDDASHAFELQDHFVTEGDGAVVSNLRYLARFEIDRWALNADAHNEYIRAEAVRALQGCLDDHYEALRAKKNFAGKVVDFYGHGVDDALDLLGKGFIPEDAEPLTPLPQSASARKPLRPHFDATRVFVEYVYSNPNDPTQGFEAHYNARPTAPGSLLPPRPPSLDDIRLA